MFGVYGGVKNKLLGFILCFCFHPATLWCVPGVEWNTLLGGDAWLVFTGGYDSVNISVLVGWGLLFFILCWLVFWWVFTRFSCSHDMLV